jgi:hypothetical protein
LLQQALLELGLADADLGGHGLGAGAEGQSRGGGNGQQKTAAGHGGLGCKTAASPDSAGSRSLNLYQNSSKR